VVRLLSGVSKSSHVTDDRPSRTDACARLAIQAVLDVNGRLPFGDGKPGAGPSVSLRTSLDSSARRFRVAASSRRSGSGALRQVADAIDAPGSSGRRRSAGRREVASQYCCR
jgi:hypothetical protein